MTSQFLHAFNIDNYNPHKLTYRTYKNFYLVIKARAIWPYKGEALVFRIEKSVCHSNDYIMKTMLSDSDAESREEHDETKYSAIG